MKLSDFGIGLTRDAGILQLMDDLGKALADQKPTAMFGGGNPAIIPGVTDYFRAELQAIADNPARLAALLGNYDTPQGNSRFIRSFVDYLNRQYAWGITPDNVAITAGSQSGFFMLFNLLAGKTGDRTRRIALPIVPEYIGYVDQLIEPDGFRSFRPSIELLGDHEFKYTIDFATLSLDESTAAIALSRPTNPTGNVVSDAELRRLAKLARSLDVPLIIDNAYGLPFPGVIAGHATPYFDSNTVLSFSLSKVGLPSARVGIFVGPPALMQALSSANAIVSLASPSYGQYIAEQAFATDAITTLCSDHIQPYYTERAAHARQLLMDGLPSDLPWRLHVYEGSYFFWLWCDKAVHTSVELYEYLKKRGVIVVPGEYFFPGQDTGQWSHSRQCIRLNFARPDQELRDGIAILAEALRWMYAR